jgi:hypothetical protein
MRIQMAAVGALAVLSLGASNAMAGKIFGDIKMDGKPVAAGVLVTLAPVPAAAKEGDKPEAGKKKDLAPPDSTFTDKVGSYKLSPKAEGKYELTIYLEKQKPSLEVFSYKDATRYDLVVEKKEGKLTVKRK